MKWVLRLFVFLVGLVVAIFLVGVALPAKSIHTRTITLRQPPEKVFDVLADAQGLPKWNRNMEKVQMLPPVDGKETMRQTFKGGMEMTIVTTESLAPSHLVRAMHNPRSPFQGLWRYQILANDGGSRVALIEQSEVSNPFFRIMLRVFGPTKYMDQHLKGLAKYFGETATIR